MAKSHFKRHPKGSKPSATKNRHPKWINLHGYDCLLFLTKMLEDVCPCGRPKAKTYETRMFDLKCSNLLPLRATQKLTKH